MFWEELNKEQKERFKELVRVGKFELVNGAISMNDCNLPNFDDILTNFKEGRTWATKNLGNLSKTAWFIDCFGFSKDLAKVLKLMGFENLVINRIFYKEKALRISKNKLDFDWLINNQTLNDESVTNVEKIKKFNYTEFIKNYNDTSKNKEEFLRTHILIKHYNSTDFAKPSSNWARADIFGIDFNLKELAEAFKYHYLYESKERVENLLLSTYGDDFTHTLFEESMISYEKLISFIRSNPKWKNLGIFEIAFATPSDYFEDLKNLNIPLSNENPDFSFYADQDKNHWTGFYTTRPLLKIIARNFLTSFKKIKTFLTLFENKFPQDRKNEIIDLFQLGNELTGIWLHHDAITGTSTIKNLFNYYNRTISFTDKFNKLSDVYLNEILSKKFVNENRKNITNLCNLGVLGICSGYKIADDKQIILSIFQSSFYSKQTIKINGKNTGYKALNINNLSEEIESDLICFKLPNVTNKKINITCNLYIPLEMKFGEQYLLQLDNYDPLNSTDNSINEFIEGNKRMLKKSDNKKNTKNSHVNISIMIN